MKEEEDGWMRAFNYMKRLRHGPPPEEMEVISLTNTFHEFLMVQMLASHIKTMPPEKREEFVRDLRKHWKMSLRRHINDRVLEHEEILKGAPSSELLREFIGDGENLRISSNKVIKKAEKRIEEMLNSLLKEVSEGE